LQAASEKDRDAWIYAILAAKKQIFSSVETLPTSDSEEDGLEGKMKELSVSATPPPLRRTSSNLLCKKKKKGGSLTPRAPLRRRGSWGARLLGRVATSSWGKVLIEKFVSTDAVKLIDLLGELVVKETGDKERSVAFQKCIYRVGARIVMVVMEKSVSKEELLLVRDPLFQVKWIFLFFG